MIRLKRLARINGWKPVLVGGLAIDTELKIIMLIDLVYVNLFY